MTEAVAVKRIIKLESTTLTLGLTLAQ
jgi:hypothetical protein